jgi:hypothetical protein
LLMMVLAELVHITVTSQHRLPYQACHTRDRFTHLCMQLKLSIGLFNTSTFNRHPSRRIRKPSTNECLSSDQQINRRNRNKSSSWPRTKPQTLSSGMPRLFWSGINILSLACRMLVFVVAACMIVCVSDDARAPLP